MPVTIEDIRAVRAELQKSDFRQTDFAVRFHIAVVDANLRVAVNEKLPVEPQTNTSPV